MQPVWLCLVNQKNTKELSHTCGVIEIPLTTGFLCRNHKSRQSRPASLGLQHCELHFPMKHHMLSPQPPISSSRSHDVSLLVHSKLLVCQLARFVPLQSFTWCFCRELTLCRKPTKIQALLLKLLQGLSSAFPPCSVPPQVAHCSSVEFDPLRLRTGPLPHIGCGKVMYYVLVSGILIAIYILGFKLFPSVRQKYIYSNFIQYIRKNIKGMVFLMDSQLVLIKDSINTEAQCPVPTE